MICFRVLTFLLLLPATVFAQDAKALKDELPRLPAVEPDKALDTFSIAHGFQLQQVAAEPLVADPVDACFDENGRMFVAEMHGYPYSSEKRAHCPTGRGKKDAGIIRLLEDTNGDGDLDRSVVFAEGISWPTSVCCYDGGVFVVAPPHVYYMKDTNGDDIADQQEIVYSGFSRSNVQGLANNLKWGFDNRIYFSSGRNGVALTHRDEKLMNVGTRNIKFNPKTEDVELISGGGQFGHSMDDYGNRFVCSNSNHIIHVTQPLKYIERNPYLSASPLRSIAKEGGAAPVFRKSPAEPWRIVRTRRRAADPKYKNRLPATELVPIGFFTSATSVTIYRGDAYPKQFRGNAFIGDVGGNLVHRKTFVENGTSLTAKRADEGREFITSTDTWFRPTNFVNAPDGTLYVLDMYRETIEHPVSIPEDIKAHLDLESGHDRGRIYRLAPPNWKRTAPKKLGKLTTAELVVELDSANAWNRITAQRLLWERQDKTAIPLVSRRFKSSKSQFGKLHLLWTLDGLGAAGIDTIELALKDKSSVVREHAVKLLERRKDDVKTLDSLRPLVTDESAWVRRQLAFTLGEIKDPRSAESLLALCVNFSDSDLRTAILSSSLKKAGRMTAFLVKHKGGTEFHNPAPKGKIDVSRVLPELVRLVGANGDEATAVSLLTDVASRDGEFDLKRRVVEGLGDGLRLRRSSLTKLLNSNAANDGVRKQVTKLFQSAVKTAADETGNGNERVAAIGLLGFAPFDSAKETLGDLLSPAIAPSFQAAAVQSLATHAEPTVSDMLLKNWSQLSPKIRAKVLDALFARLDRTKALMVALRAKKVRAFEISREKQDLLLNHSQSAIRTQAKAVLGATVNANRVEVVKKWQHVLDLESDAARGRAVFEKRCTNCHKLGDKGHQVGPELVSTSNKSPDDLLIAILDPNRERQPNFTSYNVLTHAGTTHNGIMVGETTEAITLRRAEGKEDVVLRRDIALLKSTGKSLMPEGLEKDVKAQEMADLIAFIKSLKPSKK